MNCPKCKTQLPLESKFCLSCGAQVLQNCSACLTSLPLGAKFCFSCGQLVVLQSSSAGKATSSDILGYCVGNGSAIRSSDPHFRCLQCRQLYIEKYRFQDHPVCVSCAYKDGTALQLEKEPHICPVTGMEFVNIPAGEFQMGDVWGDGGGNEKPTHLVTVPAFQLVKYPVTQSQWLEVMGGENPAASSGEKFVHPDKPVINVSWDDAHEFISRLNRKSGCSYRLPSEAEWEYAARSGGSRDKYSGTSCEASLSAYGEYCDKNGDDRTHSVGRKRPNDLGLYDMSGNVWEWCEDSWHKDYEGAPCDGSAWTSGGYSSQRVCRGGSWFNSSRCCRVAFRLRSHQGDRVCSLGFRLSQAGSEQDGDRSGV